ncbi:hypothetical protein EVAR_58505_1 [Eumeta japonica]|uniref:Uncharacterized protein n=1 Tax=Eumeta variegata TaxID=151549 RepID=A0A4C1Z9V7_EUMVA|nr:hypothetical protein EVAR_58505_1 [Eumeta japonica]
MRCPALPGGGGPGPAEGGTLFICFLVSVVIWVRNYYNLSAPPLILRSPQTAALRLTIYIVIMYKIEKYSSITDGVEADSRPALGARGCRSSSQYFYRPFRAQGVLVACTRCRDKMFNFRYK